MKLVITEKPSVAQSVAKVIGAKKRCDGYLEGGGYVVSWCVGHLVELSPPQAYNGKYGKWRYEDLPILPVEWRYEVSPSTKKQYGILKKLMQRKDVASLICATDAGREGELIFRLVYLQAGCRKPFERLWISSMEDAAIREGFENLRSGGDYDSLYAAALCRERADWLVGINATRLFSCLYGQTLNVGRVMTPTLAMVVMRDAAIRSFKPEPFYTAELDLGDFKAKSERMKEKTEADQLDALCRDAGSLTITKIEQKEKSEKAPALYDLTTLQRDANRLLGFTAKQTLDYAQSLYEKKLITYPRTDSRYLTDDMADTLPALVREMQHKLQISPETDIPVNAAQIINSKKVSDHHAIIPTKTSAKSDLSSLPSGEQAVFSLIARRLICAVSLPYKYTETSVCGSCSGAEFKAGGRTVLDMGWKAYEDKKNPSGEKGSGGDAAGQLPSLSEGAELPIRDISVKEGKTSPPKRFTEDLLLKAMETASIEEFPDEAERKGIGTPATRAGIIEKLVQKGFIERRGDKKTKYLYATDKGTALITVIPEQIQSPAMTAEWEEKLLMIEHRQYSPEAFMQEITEMVSDLVGTYEAVTDADVLMKPGGKVIGSCPACGSEVTEGRKGWFCKNKACRFALWKNSRFFEALGKQMDSVTAEKLLKDGRVYLKNCRSKKTVNMYNTTVLLTTDEEGRAVFKLEFDPKGGKKRNGRK